MVSCGKNLHIFEVSFRPSVEYFDQVFTLTFLGIAREKGKIRLSPVTKSRYTNRNVKRAKWQPPSKTSITQRLRADLGRSVGVTTATQLVLSTGLRVQPSISPTTTVQSKGHTFEN